MSLKNILYVIFLTIFIFKSTIATDKTREPKATDKDVVDAVIAQIQESKIFSDDRQMLRRIACHVSHFGKSNDTFEPKNGKPYFGGIWQIDQNSFAETQNLRLSSFQFAIKTYFDIDWISLKWEDMLKPLYSGLAARMILNSSVYDIPETVDEQAAQWAKLFHRDSSETHKFIDSVKSKDCSIDCRGRMDLCVVLDGSGSINADDFKLAKEFVANLIGTFSLENVRVGVIVYSRIASVLFSLDNKLSISQMKSTVRDANHPKLGTNTSGAMLEAVQMFKHSEQRRGVPRVMTVFTDGVSDNGVSDGTAEAKRNNISNFAVGIGTNIKQSELLEIAFGEPSHVFLRSSYKALGEFFDLMNSATCKVPQKPLFGEKISDSLAENEKRFFSYNLPKNGITISISALLGKVNAFYSYSMKTPSSAMNDGIIDGHAFVAADTCPCLRRNKKSGEENLNELFISVEGINEMNKYTILSQEGHHSVSSTLKSYFKILFLSFGFLVLLH
jgi:hypothetical protein